jgi:hypothetical protein
MDINKMFVCNNLLSKMIINRGGQGYVLLTLSDRIVVYLVIISVHGMGSFSLDSSDDDDDMGKPTTVMCLIEALPDAWNDDDG